MGELVFSHRVYWLAGLRFTFDKCISSARTNMAAFCIAAFLYLSTPKYLRNEYERQLINGNALKGENKRISTPMCF